MKPYPEYKASGIDWLGEIPSHWILPKIQYIFEFVSGNGFPIELQGQMEGEYPFYKTSDINDGGCYATASANYISQVAVDKFKFNIVPKGGIIMSKIGVALLKNHRKIATKESIIDNNLQALILKDEIYADIKYLYYFMKFFDMAWVMNDGTVPSVNNSQLRQSYIPLPPLEEQEAIAGYLDEMTGKIDALISEKTAQVEKLRAYRSSLITETVTRGLNPDAPLRDSGIDWLGIFPEHWELSKLKYITDKIGSGVTPKGGAEVYSESGILFIRSQNVYPDGLHLDEPTYITESIDEGMSNTRVYKGDILLNITGASIGRCCIYTLEAKANVNQHVCIVRPLSNIISNKYLQFGLNSKIGQTQIRLSQTGGNREGLNFDQLKNFFIPIPPLSEQQEIADFLDEKTAKIDRLIEELTKQLAELAEYKQAVITEAVTGKVDVRDYTPQTTKQLYV